ncbi:MAG: hypothetical protein ABI233_11750 [Chthoniobacterales bacterium]
MSPPSFAASPSSEFSGAGIVTWSRRYGPEDGISSLVSWAMLVTILIYIYPLKAIFNSMWDVLSDGRLGQNYGPSTKAQARAVFSSYAIGFSAIAIEIMLLNLRARQLREALRLNERERFVTLGALTGVEYPGVDRGPSLVLALTLPCANSDGAAGLTFP